MSKFEWSLPPGCTHGHIDSLFDGRPCEVCGHHCDDCICPECQTCGTCGDPACYDEKGKHFHGLVRNAEQIKGADALEEIMRERAASDRAEAEYYAHPDRIKEDAEIAQMWADLEAHHAQR